MKRSIKYFGIFLALILVLTGCKTKSAKEQLSDAVNKTNKVDSYKANVKANISLKADGQDMAYELSADGSFYKESDTAFKAYEKIKLGMSGFSFSVDAYLDFSKENFGAYINFMEQWMKVEHKFTEEEAKKVNEVFEKLKEAKKVEIDKVVKEVKSEKSDKKGYKKLTVVFDKDKINNEIKEKYNSYKDEISKNTNDESKDIIEKVNELLNKGIITKDFTITVYIKDGYISIVEIDLKEIEDIIFDNLNGILGEEESKSLKEELNKADLKATITIELSDFNKVEKITIPDAAKNAKDMSSEEELNTFSAFSGI